MRILLANAFSTPLISFPEQSEQRHIFCFVFSKEGFKISEVVFSTVQISTVHFTE
jgi:hypothetical protein